MIVWSKVEIVEHKMSGLWSSPRHERSEWWAGLQTTHFVSNNLSCGIKNDHNHCMSTSDVLTVFSWAVSHKTLWSDKTSWTFSHKRLVFSLGCECEWSITFTLLLSDVDHFSSRVWSKREWRCVQQFVFRSSVCDYALWEYKGSNIVPPSVQNL